MKLHGKAWLLNPGLRDTLRTQRFQFPQLWAVGSSEVAQWPRLCRRKARILCLKVLTLHTIVKRTRLANQNPKGRIRTTRKGTTRNHRRKPRLPQRNIWDSRTGLSSSSVSQRAICRPPIPKIFKQTNRYPQPHPPRSAKQTIPVDQLKCGVL